MFGTAPYLSRFYTHPDVTRTFSPKEFAQVIGVSESSVKRWGDAGLLAVTRTVGGHRRIVLHEALRFIRAQQMRVLRPDLLGLPDLEGLPPEAFDGMLTAEALFNVLRCGEADRARGMVVAAFLGGAAPASLFDGPLAETLHRFGTIWETDERGIYLEHVATAALIEIINAVRMLLPPPSEAMPVALGGAPAHDPYQLASMMATTVLTDAGFKPINLGPNTPASTFRLAAEAHAPRLAWLAVTAPLPEAEHTALVTEFVVPLLAAEAIIVVGGQQSGMYAWPEGVQHLASMEELDALARAHVAA